MSSESITATAARPEPHGLVGLFIAFAKMSLMGFGGVMVWARRAIVEQHRWLTAEEFNETFALCHFLPGPNVVNLSVVFGSRLRGVAGGGAALARVPRPPGGSVRLPPALSARVGGTRALRPPRAAGRPRGAGLLVPAV